MIYHNITTLGHAIAAGNINKAKELLSQKRSLLAKECFDGRAPFTLAKELDNKDMTMPLLSVSGFRPKL